MTQLESLLAERLDIVKDLWKYGDNLESYTHDLLTNRIEMLDSMIEMENNA